MNGAIIRMSKRKIMIITIQQQQQGIDLELSKVINDAELEDKQSTIKKKSSSNLLVIKSGSGNSKNIINAVKVAKNAGVKVIGMTGYDGGALYELADYHLHAPINDMMKAEDIHMSFDHMMATILLHVLDDIKVNK